jgi:UDP:flavonoid glycosyltransferase YjiC (YdhE family)
MHVLATVTGNASHTRSLAIALNPLIDAGHDVTIAATPDLAPLLADLKAAVHGVLPGMHSDTRTAEPRRAAGPDSTDVAAWLTAAPSVLDSARAVIEVAETRRPDVIVRDDAEFGGMLAGEHLGIPHISLCGGATNLLDPAVAIEGVNRHWAALGHDRPLPAEAIQRHGRVDYVPEEFSFAAHDTGMVHRYRQPVLTRTGERLPEWIAELPGTSPFIYASLGTALPVVAANRSHGTQTAMPMATDPVRALAAIIDAVSEMDCVAMISTCGLPTPGTPTPEHVHIVEHAPQPLVLEVADLFITHGGYNGIREALRAATPMLVIPSLGDQPHDGRRITELGLGEMTTETTGARVRQLAGRILAEPGYTRRAWQARARTLALPPLDQFVQDLQSLSDGVGMVPRPCDSVP